ncbi:MAG: polysaccharide deacetylase family protein [Lentihominibacter sp.]|nr:polysaccharide deacetylase family protein [Lentihominibacter sp.]
MDKEMDKELDERMNEAVVEARRSYQDRDRKRRRKRKIRKAVAVIILLGAVCLTVGLVTHHFAGRAFRTEKQFQEFASRAYDEEVLYRENEKPEVKCTFDKEFSVATRMSDECSDEIMSYRDKRMESVTQYYKDEYCSEDDDMSYALIWDVSVDKSGTGADSLVISSRLYGENDEEVTLIADNVETHLYSEETGRGLQPLQVLNTNYRDKAAEYVVSHLEKKYGDKLKPGWETFTAPEDANYNKFAFCGDNIVFYFDEDTVLDRSEGTLAVNVPSRIMEDSLRAQVLERYIDPNAPMVAITYDDGPGGESEERILDCLEKNGSVATFFYLGSRVKTNPDVIKRAVDMGCEPGNHSWNHPQFTKLTKKEMKKQVAKTQEAVEKACGSEPEVFRPPYGDQNDKVIETVDMPAFLWTVDTLDWKTRNPKKIFKSVKNKKKLDGSVILMHSIYDETADATELIVPWLREHGYQTVTLSELVEYKTGRTPADGTLYRSIK